MKRSGGRTHGCYDHLLCAPLWVSYEANLGTLLRSCEAVGACLVVPRTQHYRRALQRGRTNSGCIHWITSKENWLARERQRTRIVATEITEGARSLAWLPPAKQRTIVLLGHEHHGIPPDVLAWAETVQIPGGREPINVAVAGSLVLYKLAGLL